MCRLAGVAEYDHQKDSCQHTELHFLHALDSTDLRFAFSGLIFTLITNQDVTPVPLSRKANHSFNLKITGDL